MKICFISREYPPETGFGGIGTYTYQLAQGLTKKGHDVTVISQAVKKAIFYKDKKVKVYRIFDDKVPFRGFTKISNLLTGNAFSHYWHSRSVFKKINQLVNQGGKFDIIEGPLWDGECLAYNYRIGVPLVVRLQTPIFKSLEILGKPKNKSVEFVERKTLEKAVLIPSISNNVASLISSCYKIPKSKIRLCYLGIEFPKIKKPVFKENSYKLLYVGRLEKRKGTQEFIESLNEILSKNEKITIDIIGKDIPQAPGQVLFKKYFEKIVNKEYKKRVKFHGFVDFKKLELFYKKCDLFIAPSRYESFGLIFLEAYLYGKPVIGTTAGAIPELVSHGTTGLLVEPNNSSQIAKAVLKVFKNDSLRKRMGEQAFMYVRKNFTVGQMVDRSLDIYNEAIKKYKKNYGKFI